ncbi:MAG TPA: rhamnulokinase family protein [Tepidisphaeraceae bacterium]|jgi:rhamnulokinase
MPQFIAFDLGAESGRAILATLRKNRLTLQEKHRFANPTGRVNGHLHWNILAQWEELKKGLSLAAANQKQIHGIGVDTWGVDFGLLDKSGNLLGNPFHYRDSRNDGVMERALKKVSRQKIYQTTGLQFLPFNTLFQLLATQRDQPEILDVADKLLFMPDLFNFFFTGIPANEYSIASTSQMLDVKKRQWAGGMLNKVSLPRQLMQKIIPSGTVLGDLQKSVASECNVAKIPVIAPACHDTASAVVAVPAEDENFCYISSGTWSLMGVELKKPILTDDALTLNYTNEGGANNTIRFLKNIMGLWLVQECRRQFLADGHNFTYAQLTQMAARSAPLRSLVDPNDVAFLAPGNMPERIQSFCRRTRQPVPSTPGELVRCALESLAIAYRDTMLGLEKILGRKISAIHIVGGGSQNELLNQFTAAACNRPVIGGPIEATAIGNALAQAVAIGAIASWSDARKIVRQSFPVKYFHPRHADRWRTASIPKAR